MYYNEETEYDGRQADAEEREGIVGYCHDCGRPLTEDELVLHREVNFCKSCFRARKKNICDICGEAILEEDDMLEENGHVFCEDCMSLERTECEWCGELIVEGDKCIIFEFTDKRGISRQACICDDCCKTRRDRFARREGRARV